MHRRLLASGYCAASVVLPLSRRLGRLRINADPLGGEIVVPTLDGQERMKVPDGTQTGTTLRLRGKGMPDVCGRGRGDLLVTVQVQTPKKLSKEQRQILEQLAKALPKEQFEPRAPGEEGEDRNLFDRVKDMFG